MHLVFGLKSWGCIYMCHECCTPVSCQGTFLNSGFVDLLFLDQKMTSYSLKSRFTMEKKWHFPVVDDNQQIVSAFWQRNVWTAKIVFLSSCYFYIICMMLNQFSVIFFSWLKFLQILQKSTILGFIVCANWIRFLFADTS